MFASEHLNNNTPIHVIQALLGHTSPDTVMVYAKLYPATLIEEYRKAVRATYLDFHGPKSDRVPDAEEWRQFSKTLELRDMGTHLCALPAGEHCSRGLVCLGCGSAQPKKSAAPLFGRMLASHEKALGRARERGEPAGRPARSPHASWRFSASAARCGALATSTTTLPPRSRPPDAPPPQAACCSSSSAGSARASSMRLASRSIRPAHCSMISRLASSWLHEAM